jgi:hypothetical protein
VRGALKWQAELRAEEFAANWDTTIEAVRQAIVSLGSCGLVGYDLSRAAYFHREFPFDLALVGDLHPRLKAAHELVAREGVRVLRTTEDGMEADVEGSSIVHRVRLAESGGRCSCTWYAKHQGEREPCTHILAVQIATQPES